MGLVWWVWYSGFGVVCVSVFVALRISLAKARTKKLKRGPYSLTFGSK